jgi:hypothetical protein
MDGCISIGLRINIKNDYRDLDNEQALKRSLMKSLRGEGQPYLKECRHSF